MKRNLRRSIILKSNSFSSRDFKIFLMLNVVLYFKSNDLLNGENFKCITKDLKENITKMLHFSWTKQSRSLSRKI